ncbi:hypothetical protein HD806DRAFT_520658 [Xylariaceae sp. AK1471]|nr:hypothetical protein HD806DRAFT_520658 [Xylariaceae sp. AK1471]
MRHTNWSKNPIHFSSSTVTDFQASQLIVDKPSYHSIQYTSLPLDSRFPIPNSSFAFVSMAPSTRARCRGDIATTLRPSIEVAADSTPLLSNSNNLGKSSNTGLGPSKAENPKILGLETLESQIYVLVLGKEMLVPQTYDPDTYNPETRMPWTPEPEPYDPEKYAAWGRKHFGDDWHELRKVMLQERNIYLQYDRVYRERQRALRIMEHKIERRPFEPRDGWMCDEGWKRVWTRISKDLGIKISSNPASPTPPKHSDDSDTDLSGYDTYPPTLEPRDPTPLADDPWDRLEYNRRRFNWDEEEYQYEKIFLKEAIKDGVRTQHEDEDGDKQARQKREAMESFRYADPARFSLEKRRSQAHVDLPKKGWTREQIDAEYDADIALHKRRKKNPEPKGSGLYGLAATPEDKAASDIWLQKLDTAKIRFYGELPPKGSGPFGFSATQEDSDAMEIWRKNIHARVSRQQQGEALPSAIINDSAPEVEPNTRGSFSRKTKGLLRQTRSGRITKNAPTHCGASLPDRWHRPSQPDTLEELGDNAQTAPQRHNRQRKTYKKERASRRLAGELPDRSIYKASLRQPLKTGQVSGSSCRNSKLSKKLVAMRSAKP